MDKQIRQGNKTYMSVNSVLYIFVLKYLAAHLVLNIYDFQYTCFLFCKDNSTILQVQQEQTSKWKKSFLWQVYRYANRIVWFIAHNNSWLKLEGSPYFCLGWEFKIIRYYLFIFLLLLQILLQGNAHSYEYCYQCCLGVVVTRLKTFMHQIN